MARTSKPDDAVPALANSETASALAQALKETIEQKPYVAVGIALALGWFWGRMHRPF
jgi:ElaB/YqjD/DUF883 family membrane-anchored ribosome-binding protein